MVGTEPSWTTIPGKAGSINHNVCRKTYEKHILESNIPWHTGYPMDRPCSPRPRSPLPSRGDECGNDRLAKRNSSVGSCSTSSSLGRQDTNRAAMQTSRGLWRDLPRYGRHGGAPFEVDFAGRQVAKETVCDDQRTARRSLSPARLRYMMEMAESGPNRELAPARRRKAKPRSVSPQVASGSAQRWMPEAAKQAAPRSFSPPPPAACCRREVSPAGEDQALAASQSQLGSWMSLGESPARGLAKALSRPCVDGFQPERGGCQPHPAQTAPLPLSTGPQVPQVQCHIAPAAAPAAVQGAQAPVLRLPVQPRMVCGFHCEPVTIALR